MIQNSDLPKQLSAKVFGVSTRAYYKWKKRPRSPDPDCELRFVIHPIASEFPKYGYRRVTHALRREGFFVNHKKVLRIMKEEKLTVRTKKRNPRTTQSNHGFQKYPNLAKNTDVDSINTVWVSDITYIRLRREFVYLAAITDLYSRRCVGWALSRKPNTELTLDALHMAVSLRGKEAVRGCIHHSDQGVQYASTAYVDALTKHGLKPSMGEVGNSYDNAFAESFFKTLKNEEVWINDYETIEDVYYNIKHFIEEVYNKKRIHSSIGYVPPIEYEEKKNLYINAEA